MKRLSISYDDEDGRKATLIAAAPKLLDRLIQANESLHYLAPDKFDDQEHEKSWNALLASIAETITQAEGKG